MKKILVILLLSPAFAFAQSTIKGKVLNTEGGSGSNVNALLLRAKDSSLVKAAVCDKDGMYFFSNIAEGDYLVQLSYAGHKQVHLPATITKRNGNVTIDPVSLTKEEVALAGVTVVAKKPLLEQKIDRLIVNVANSITSAGNTALEVLERSPGILVDHQNNVIGMNGKSGVVIMINGKISHMPMSAIVQLLDGMSAGNIEKIELITTPPANFDAEGNAGYINIVLKQNENYGTNGSLSATLGYGQGWVEEGSININHRNGHINLFGDLSYSRVRKPFTADGYFAVSNSGNLTETIFRADRVDTTPNINGRLGMDWQAGKKTVMGVLFTGYDNRYSQGETNGSTIFVNKALDTTVSHENTEVNHWYGYSGNVNLQQDFSANDKLLINIDQIYWNNNQPVNYSNSYYDRMNNFVYSQQLQSGKLTPIRIWVAAADYFKKISSKVNFEGGVKQTISTFDNDISFHRFLQSQWVKDSSLSARYKLMENYSAAYGSFDIAFNEKTEMKLGLRYEYTNSNLGTTITRNIVDHHYGNLFPSFFISHKTGDNTAVNFSYSRRITRPTFNDLAPFTYYANANTLLTGNPALQPAISDNFNTAYSFKNWVISLAYSTEKNSIAGFQPQADSVTNKLVLTAENLTQLRTVSLSLSFPVTVTSWWSMQYNANGVWQQTNTLYKQSPVQVRQSNFNINAVQRFTLPKDFSIEVTGFYQSAALFGLYRTLPAWTLDAGIRKKLPGKGGSVIFNASNIFNTSNFRFKVNLPEQNLVSETDLYFSRPTFKLTYTKSFGNDKLKGQRQRNTGAEEEKGRVQ